MANYKPLTATFLKSAPVGQHCDGRGLYFVKREDGGAQWNFRYTCHGRRRLMGLGGYPELTLANARISAEEHRAVLAGGKDPKRERDAARREASRSDISLSAIALMALETRKNSLKDGGKTWLGNFRRFVEPKLGSVPITDIHQTDIQRTLAPLLETHVDTVRKTLNVLHVIFEHGAAMGLDDKLINTVPLAKNLLNKGKSARKSERFKAMPYADVPAFYEQFSSGENTKLNLAMRFYILAPSPRLKPLRHMRLEQITYDEQNGHVWTVPADGMKGKKNTGKDYRVPLCQELLDIIELAKPQARNGYVFPSGRGGPMRDNALNALMMRLGYKGIASPHGFRTSMFDWLKDKSDASHSTAEAMLAHVGQSTGDKHYTSTDHLEKRRVHHQRWADFVTGKTGQVIELAARDTKTA